MSGGVDLSALDALHAAGQFDEVFVGPLMFPLRIISSAGLIPVSLQALDGCTKCIQENSQNVECLIRRCRWSIDLSAQKPDSEKLPLMCVQFPLVQFFHLCSLCIIHDCFFLQTRC
jgi:hypothetical protein